MRVVPTWRAFLPTSRDVRFAIMQWLDREYPSVCTRISVSTKAADLEEFAACPPLAIVESAEESFGKAWLDRFNQDFAMELGMEGQVSESAKLELHYATCDDVWVFGHTGQVVEARTNGSFTPVSRGSSMPSLLKTRYLEGIGFSLLTGRPGHRKNYYHFLMEKLPEHLALLDAAVDTYGQLTLLLPTTDHPLETALVSEAQRRFPDLPVRRIGLSEKVRCEAVVIHRAIRSSIFRSPASRRLLSASVAAMRQSFQRSPIGGRSRRLFVSRSDAKKRRLANEQEIFARLKRFDFEYVVPGQLPLDQQIALFSESQIVAGPHGAGLTNVAFMPPGGSVIEIFRSDWVLGSYAWLSHLVGQRYGYVVSNESAKGLDYRLTGEALNAFERKIEAALMGRSSI